MRLTCQRRKITLDVQAERESGSKKEMKTVAGCYDGRRDLELRGGKKPTNDVLAWWRGGSFTTLTASVQFLLRHYNLPRIIILNNLKMALFIY